MSRWLSDRIVEEAGRRIYESQQSRLSDQSTCAAKRVWRSEDVPAKFWNSYVEDARAALQIIVWDANEAVDFAHGLDVALHGTVSRVQEHH